MDAATFMGVERLDDSTWRMPVTERVITPGKFMFGGCGLASAVVALEAATGRPTIWSTAHYLSHAPLGSEVTIKVEVPAVGGRVTQARATTWVDDREVLTVHGAFGRATELSEPNPWLQMPVTPAPLDSPPRRLPHRFEESVFTHIESRLAKGRTFESLDGTPGEPVWALWARLPGQLEVSSATLAIFGDFLSGGFTQPLGRNTMGRSLDNTIRISQIVPTEWVLMEMHMHSLVNGFGHGTAFMWSESGVLLGTASQSVSAKIFEMPAPE
jgi:acyl-CoA thioesterase